MPTETRASAGEEEKKEDLGDMKDNRPQERPASRQSPTITMTNASRPPSAASVHSNDGAPPPPRTTAMSRRGGRTRSRSPSSMTMNRPPSTTPSEASNHQHSTATAANGPAGGNNSSNQPPVSPANPSAAAAAAAAAAKSLRTTGNSASGNGNTNSVTPSSSTRQYPPGSYGGPFDAASRGVDPSSARGGYGGGSSNRPMSSYRGYGSGGGPPPPHLRAAPGYYDPHGYGAPPLPHHHPSRGGPWPPPSDRAPSRNGDPASGSSSNKPSGSSGPPPRRDGNDPYGYNPHSRGGRGGPPPPGYRGDPYHHHHRYPGDDSGEYSRRGPPPPYGSYPGYRGGPKGAPPPPHPSYRCGGPSPPDGSDPYGYTGRSPAKGGNSDTSSSQDKNGDGMKSTKTVIGTATPIHVPRAADNSTAGPLPSASAESRRGSAASVFRGRPGSDGPRSNPPRQGNGAGGRMEEDDNNPQKILMSLRTPSNSFEEKKSERADDDDGNNDTSPQDPPQLRNMFSEPQRSPKSGAAGPPQPTNSLDMAPSFSLFNQSFDSLGDTAGFFNVGGPLDSALQSTSFGGAASILEDKSGLGMGDLQLTASNGTFKLNPSSSGGALTFGMSPTNSFGNGPTSSFSTRGGNVTLLGNDHRAASPSVLDLGFRSGPGVSPRTKPSASMDEVNLRLSASMGSPSFTRQYVGEPGPPQGHYQPPPRQHYGHPYQMSAYPTHRPYRTSTTPAPDGAPHFYIFLRRHKEAFREVTFLLPGLRSYMDKDSKKEDNDETPKRQGRDRRSWAEPNQSEAEIAQRRIASAVCAFGGTFIGSRMNKSNNATASASKSKTSSIFREKSGGSATPTASDGPKVSRKRAKYDEALPGRYYENDNRLSWEFEEKPPIGDANDSDDDDEYDDNGNKRSKKGGSKSGDGKKGKSEGSHDEDDGSGEENEDGTKKDGKKIKYRCKLCGQPKQNHSCPYQQSLARSIGVMVYPAVNAFTSDEPGVLAPALSEMNNFIGVGADSVGSDQGSPSRPTPDRLRRLNASGSHVGSSTAQVTPESLRGTPRGVTSPAPYSTPQRPGARSSATPGSVTSSTRKSVISSRKKRPHGQMNGEVGTQDDLLFVEPMDLKPEQFRMVTPSKPLNHPDAFTYPALPLPYAQRKRLSDNLFSLSKEIPQLTDECASVLREARERDMWDLAVAELMTQVVVVVHCHDGDMCFEGLRRYLLTLGISS